MSITIIQNGILDTIQDLGRYGHANAGINTSGCMDTVAARAANFLVGNDEHEALIEMHFPAPVIRFDQAACIAIAGADLGAKINDQVIPINTTVVVPAGSVLRFEKQLKGARAYFAVKGGFQLNKWLDSYSTNLKASAGGLEGNALQQNDTLFFQRTITDQTTDIITLPWHADLKMIYNNDPAIRFVAGNENHILSECAVSIFESNDFVITSRSDRMGFRLNGSPLETIHKKEMISSAVTKGTIQLLPDGQTIILMADHQTTGGYPRIGHVISADLSSLAQMNTGTQLKFQKVSIEEAEQLYILQCTGLLQLQNACNFRWNEWSEKHNY